ncbi:MAG: putative 2OG-Fe(II) oxygenase [Pseudomonadota bacterium]
MAKTEIIGLFPTPLMVCRGVLGPDLVTGMVDHYDASEKGANVRTALLSHTPMTSPGASNIYQAVLSKAAPMITEFGETILGERLNWGVKEIWINRMETGGAQKLHNHANSFISGIIYLSESHEGSLTMFHRPTQTNSFVMTNENKNTKMTAFNASVFRAPQVGPGDMILFPSYILHEVPPNQGGSRMTAAFNALPERVDSWGYTVRFK